MKKKTIVMLDDSPIVLSVFRAALGALGHDVVTISSPFALAPTMRSARPDLVLVDVNMPALNGDKVVEIARRALDDRVHIVLFSDKSESELASLASACGASGFIRKTGDAATVAARVEEWLNDRA
jgi:DNA-binding NarL/FixJ family response regulator